MQLARKKTVTPGQLAANRANALKSTGPRTPEGKNRVSLNSLRHGLYSSLDTRLRLALERRGDDPQEYEQLHKSLMEAWRPDDPMQELIVEDLADLFWLKRVSRRAVALRQGQEAEQDDIKRTKARLWAGAGTNTSDSDSWKWSGWRRAEASPQKFEALGLLLDELEERVEKCNWSEKRAREIFDHLYHWSTGLGEKIMQLFWSLAGQESTDSEQRKALKDLIQQERASVAEEQQLYERERSQRIEQSPEHELKPLTFTWARMLSQNAALDYQIAGKVRLLMQLKDASRRQSQDACEADGNSLENQDVLALESALDQGEE